MPVQSVLIRAAELEVLLYPVSCKVHAASKWNWPSSATGTRHHPKVRRGATRSVEWRTVPGWDDRLPV